MPVPTSDVVVIGGGIIGLSTARELALTGVSVRVVEQSRCGNEASWAGAGILPPGDPRFCAPESLLRAASHPLWEPLSRSLREETGIDNGFRRCGVIELGSAAESLAFWQTEHVPAELLSAGRLREREPGLAARFTEGVRLPEAGQVRNPRHLKALLASCRQHGVIVEEGQPVVGFERGPAGNVTAVRTPIDRFEAGRFVVAGGAWSRTLVQSLGFAIPVEPVRGQIVLLNPGRMLFEHVLELGSRYLVPRPDGRVLVGATEEHVGFDRRTTAGEVAGLIAFATEVVPELRNAEVERAWSGLRPGTPDRRPYVDRVPETENVFLAAGHFRAGLQTSPATAIAMRDLVLEREPPWSLDAFGCRRTQRVVTAAVSNSHGT